MTSEQSGSLNPIGVCIIVENMSVPRDPRVWREAVTLAEAGYAVSVISPKSPGSERSPERLNGIDIYRHSVPQASSLFGYVAEYMWALAAEFFLVLRIFARNRFHILQICNPPDTIFLIALFLKLFRVRVIFDQHDPVPEFFEARYRSKGLLYRLLCFAERLTFQVSDVAMVTNESCKEIAMTRGAVPPERCFIVRNCPRLNDFPLRPPNPQLKDGKAYLIIYVGTMGSLDGIDLLLESAKHVCNQGRNDVLFALIGTGSEVPKLRAQASKLGLDHCVRFTGALYGDDLKAYLASADVGVSPDPLNVFNNKLTMIKIMEYMACGLPIVLYDLAEGRRSANDAALYAKPNDTFDFAAKILTLLDSQPLRRDLGQRGAKRVREHLNWESEKQKLLQAYEAALDRSSRVGYQT